MQTAVDWLCEELTARDREAAQLRSELARRSAIATQPMPPLVSGQLLAGQLSRSESTPIMQRRESSPSVMLRPAGVLPGPVPEQVCMLQSSSDLAPQRPLTAPTPQMAQELAMAAAAAGANAAANLLAGSLPVSRMGSRPGSPIHTGVQMEAERQLSARRETSSRVALDTLCQSVRSTSSPMPGMPPPSVSTTVMPGRTSWPMNGVSTGPSTLSGSSSAMAMPGAAAMRPGWSSPPTSVTVSRGLGGQATASVLITGVAPPQSQQSTARRSRLGQVPEVVPEQLVSPTTVKRNVEADEALKSEVTAQLKEMQEAVRVAEDAALKMQRYSPRQDATNNALSRFGRTSRGNGPGPPRCANSRSSSKSSTRKPPPPSDDPSGQGRPRLLHPPGSLGFGNCSWSPSRPSSNSARGR